VGDYTVLWTGDSITDCGRREDPAGLGHGYVRRLAAAPALVGVRTVNTGVGGDLSGDLALRWADDVLAYRPDVVSVLIGINDVWRRYDGSGRITSSAEFEGNLRGMLGKLPSGVRGGVDRAVRAAGGCGAGAVGGRGSRGQTGGRSRPGGGVRGGFRRCPSGFFCCLFRWSERHAGLFRWSGRCAGSGRGASERGGACAAGRSVAGRGAGGVATTLSWS
jgi:hypothetical protein